MDNAKADLDHLREEKDAEIQILQEGMDTTIQQLSDAQAVRNVRFGEYFELNHHSGSEPRFSGRNDQCSDRHFYLRQPQEAEPDHRCVLTVLSCNN